MTTIGNDDQDLPIDHKDKPQNAMLSVSYGIAALFLKDAYEKGYGFEIPSLGIKIEGIGRGDELGQSEIEGHQ